MTLQEFLISTFTAKGDWQDIRPILRCQDGFYMSVQGSYSHYCSPRENGYIFDTLEVGFPSEREDLLIEFAEDLSNPTETVYAFVPADIIQQVINKHGGIAP